MSSLLRRIARRSERAKTRDGCTGGGRPCGCKHGVHNPKDAALLARKARDERWGRV